MVAVAASAQTRAAAKSSAELGWSAAAAATLVIGLAIRLALGGAGVGDRSAIVMITLLSIGVWVAARRLGGARTAFLAMAALLALLDLAALPTRGAPSYDDLEAFYRTDQVLTAQLALPSAALRSRSAVLTLLAQPVYVGAQPAFGLAGEVNGTAVSWRCGFQRGIQQLALPLPSSVLRKARNGLNVRLHLNGAPSRETDYLVVYASSRRGGFLVSLEAASRLGQAASRCTRVRTRNLSAVAR